MKPVTLQVWLKNASQELHTVGISSARLDAEIILAHTIRKSRTYLHAHGDEPLPSRENDIADARLALRTERTPIAYIIGHKEFYGRTFRVTPATLIPRPESEDLITLLKESAPKGINARCVDVGTGSGCLGITAKLEVPQLEVALLDISRHALQVAEANAKALRAEVTFTQSDLLEQLLYPVQYIIANLPYVDPTWERSPETDHEPDIALFAKDGGVALIFSLLRQTLSHLSSGGYLLLEADPSQHEQIANRAAAYSLKLVRREGYALCFKKS